MSRSLESVLALLPRVEIHIHLEGSVQLRRLRAFWQRPGRDPALPSDPATLFRHRSFPDFLQHFALVTRAIRTPADLAAITSDLCQFLARQGIVAAEVFFSPVIFTRRGLPFGEMMDSIQEAAVTSERAGGPSIAWILDGIRQWGIAGLEELLDCARMAPGRILGIGMGGDERSVPAQDFSELFAEARRMGLMTVAHAGEFDSARSVREAVEILGAERIGHGIRAAEDREVLGLLKRRRIPLEVCPTSNLRTGVVRRWKDHPLTGLIRSGVRVTLNSDDPALFRTSLAGEYDAVHRRLGLTPDALFRIHLGAIAACRLPPEEKRRLRRRSMEIWRKRSALRPDGGRSPGKISRGPARA